MKIFEPNLFALGAILAALGVVFGAFGAHSLESMIGESEQFAKRLENWKTATLYLWFHAIGLMLVGLVPTMDRRWRGLVAFLFVAGALLFSMSLYALVLFEQRWLGMVVPIGGVSWVVGWSVFAWSVWRGAVPVKTCHDGTPCSGGNCE